MTDWQDSIPPLRWYRKQSWWVRTLITPFAVSLPFMLIALPSAGLVALPFYLIFPAMIAFGLIFYQEPAALREPSLLPRLDRGEAQLRGGQYDDAVMTYSSIIEKLPDYTSAYVFRSVAYRGLGQLNAAERDLEKALELNPHHSRARAEYAQLKEITGKGAGN